MNDQRIHPSIPDTATGTTKSAALKLKGHAEQDRDAAALRFANIVVEKRGRIDDVDFKALTHAGFTAEQAGWLACFLSAIKFAVVKQKSSCQVT